MSGNYFAVDTDALAKAAPEIEKLARRIHAVNAKLQARTSAVGQCWGDDENGQRFAKQYLRPKSQMLKGIDKASKVLDSVADGVKTMSKGFAKTEENAVEAVSSIKKNLPSKFPNPSSSSPGSPKKK